MTRRRHALFAVVTLCMASLLLVGCPKKPAPAAGTPPGSGSEGSAASTSGTGPGVAAAQSGSGASGIPGPGAAGGAAASGGAQVPGGAVAGGSVPAPGAAQATGTTTPALPSPKDFVETSALSDIHFDFDKYEIRPSDAKILQKNADWLKSNVTALLLIEGHCDERGTNEYNLALGQRRAKVTRDYLASLGVDGSRITLISYGEERPLCKERTEACWVQNRRAHFLVKQ